MCYQRALGQAYDLGSQQWVVRWQILFDTAFSPNLLEHYEPMEVDCPLTVQLSDNLILHF